MKSWSYVNPRLQLAWDPTSLRALMKCPRYYQYTIVEGWRRGDNVHLDFGSMFQECVELFQRLRLRGTDLPTATREMLRRALQISGHYAPLGAPDYEPDALPALPFSYTWHPWGGVYVRRWRCTGTEPYKNAKGNKAKCPNAHARVWQDGARTEPCALCLSPVELQNQYTPEHPSKHRLNLVRALCLFAERQHATRGLQPYSFPDGTEGVEINLTVPMGRAIGDESYLLSANIDELNALDGLVYITDNKTTKDPLNERYFQQYSPDIQPDVYDLVASIGWPDLPLGGLAWRAFQVTKEGVDTKTARIHKTPAQREELWRDLHYWLDQAERFAADGYWPMNRAACRGCEFAGPVCDQDPEFREAHLAADFEKRGAWDPLERPGRSTGESK